MLFLNDRKIESDRGRKKTPETDDGTNERGEEAGAGGGYGLRMQHDVY